MAEDITREYYIGYAGNFPEIRDGQVLYDSYENKLYIDINNERKLVNQTSSPEVWNKIVKPPITWEEIINNQDYATDYQLGMIMDLEYKYSEDDIEIVPMQLVAFNTDIRADEDVYNNNGKARMTWISRDIFTTASMCQMMDDPDWYSCSLRDDLNTYMIQSLPEVLQDNIIQVKKISNAYINQFNDYMREVSQDKLWIPSRNELFGDFQEYESNSIVYDFFKNGDNTLLSKCFIGDDEPSVWILRSIDDNSKGNIFAINTDGSLTTVSRHSSNGLVFGFCI